MQPNKLLKKKATKRGRKNKKEKTNQQKNKPNKKGNWKEIDGIRFREQRDTNKFKEFLLVFKKWQHKKMIKTNTKILIKFLGRSKEHFEIVKID